MAANAQQLKEFLAKRGYDAEVEQIAHKNFIVSMKCKSTEEVSQLFANITDGNRIIVQLSHPDILEMVDEGLQISDRLSNMEEAISEIREVIQTLDKTYESRVNSTNNKLSNVAEELEQQILEEKNKAWYKKPWRTKR